MKGYQEAVALMNSLGKELSDLVSSYSDEFSPIELSRYFVKVRQVKDMLEEIEKGYAAFYEELAKIKIPQVFDREGVPSITLDEGYRVTVSHQMRASIRVGAKEAAYDWLRANGLGDLISETVNSSTLSAAAKAMMEENRELPDGLFNSAVLANTSFTKVKK